VSVRVAIQGERGAFSHQAALALVGPDAAVVFTPSFDALFEALAGGAAERALVPIENSLHGSIHENYDRLKQGAAHVVGEHVLPVRQCLIVRPGTGLADVGRVASHPVALAQCRRFFATHPGIEAVVAADTAGSVRLLMAGELPADAAIASALAAREYGASVLQAGVEDDPRSFTRFLLLAREPLVESGADKTSLVLTLPDRPGALHRALGVFASRGIDLSKIESRPLPGRPFEYAFYLDVIGDPRGACGEALAELRGLASELRVLGSYRAAREQPPGPAA
jgi:prephenate dehydratase